MTDIDVLATLQPPSAVSKSYLTDLEWDAVFAARDRGVIIREIYESFACHKGYTLPGFYQAIRNREMKYTKRRRTVRPR